MAQTFVNESEPILIKCTGEYTFEEYTGNFTFKRQLSNADRLRQDQLRRQYVGAQNPQDASERTRYLSEMLSQIQARLIKAPSWFTERGNGLDLPDEEPVLQIYDAAMTVEKSYRDERRAAAEQAQRRMRGERDADQAKKDADAEE